jgi:hypothetical protein
MIPILPRSGNHLVDNYDDFLDSEESWESEKEVENDA